MPFEKLRAEMVEAAADTWGEMNLELAARVEELESTVGRLLAVLQKTGVDMPPEKVVTLEP
jgi:hypothetical protein